MKTDWDLILRYINNETSPEEVKRIEELLKTDPEFDKEIKLIETVNRTPAKDLAEPDVEAALNRVKEKIELAENDTSREANIYKLDTGHKSPFEKPVSRYIIRAAAVFIVFLVGIYLVSKYYDRPTQGGVLVTVNTTEVEEVTLPDGTIVTLDAGSSLNYPEKFDGANRTVKLKGEGFFKVIPNPNKPFIIHAPNATVTVLGTAFNLRAWDDYKKAVIAVEEGKVSFKAKTETTQEKVILTKGEMSIIAGDAPPTPPVPAEVDKYTAWQKREIHFQSTPLKKVLDQLSRWYDLEFQLPGDAYANELVTVYIQNEPVDNILDLISLTMNFTYERDGNKVTFQNGKH